MHLNFDSFSLSRFFILVMAIVSLFMPELVFSQWVFVARHAIGRIEQVSQNQSTPGHPATEVVTVILDAPAQRVYDVALATIQKNQYVNIVSADSQNLGLKISQDGQMATLSIRSLGDDSSQLMIIGPVVQGQNSGATRIADGIINICNGLGKNCELANQ